LEYQREKEHCQISFDSLDFNEVNNETLFNIKEEEQQSQDIQILTQSLDGDKEAKDLEPENLYEEDDEFKLGISLLDIKQELDEGNSSGQEATVSNRSTIKKHDTRKDVLFKNVFRSIKKFYTSFFKKNSAFFELQGKKKRKAKAEEYVLNFVTEYLLKHDDAGIFQSTDTIELADYIGRIVIPDFLGKTNCSYKCK